MQITSQQYPEHRMRLPQIREVPKDYSGELLISCLDLSRVGYLCPDIPFSLARIGSSPMPAWQDVLYKMS